MTADPAMLLAEEFVLLAVNSTAASVRAESHAAMNLGVTAALLTELSQGGHLDLKDGRVHLTGTKPSQPLLRQVVNNLSPHEGARMRNRLPAIRHAGWNEVVELMVMQRRLGRQRNPLLSTRMPVLCSAERAEVMRRVRGAASNDGPTDDRTAALLALAGACQLLDLVTPDRGSRQLANRRIEAAIERTPAAEAVRHAVQWHASPGVLVAR